MTWKQVTGNGIKLDSVEPLSVSVAELTVKEPAQKAVQATSKLLELFGAIAEATGHANTARRLGKAEEAVTQDITLKNLNYKDGRFSLGVKGRDPLESLVLDALNKAFTKTNASIKPKDRQPKTICPGKPHGARANGFCFAQSPFQRIIERSISDQFRVRANQARRGRACSASAAAAENTAHARRMAQANAAGRPGFGAPQRAQSSCAPTQRIDRKKRRQKPLHGAMPHEDEHDENKDTHGRRKAHAVKENVRGHQKRGKNGKNQEPHGLVIRKKKEKEKARGLLPFARLGAGLFRGRHEKRLPEVFKRENRVLHHHAGSGIAHDSGDLFLHLRLVAVHAALGAHGLSLAKGAAGKALHRIGLELLALRTQAPGGGALLGMVAAAVDVDHRGHGARLARKRPLLKLFPALGRESRIGRGARSVFTGSLALVSDVLSSP